MGVRRKQFMYAPTFRPVAFQPPAYRPARLAQAVPILADEPVIQPPLVPEGIIWTSLAAAASYASIYTATHTDKGFLKVAGWAGGVAAGLAALIGLTGIL